jgi:hypothetical protein
MNMNDIKYENCFDPYVKFFIKITLEDEYDKKLATAISRLIHKEQINLGRRLTAEELKPFEKVFIQLGGEVVMEQYLGIDFIDYENIGLDSSRPHMSKIYPNIDITTFTYGFFPLVWKNTFRKTLFICRMSKKEYYICGVGTPGIINSFSSNSLVQSPYLKKTKKGFYGFYHLKYPTEQIFDFTKILH